MKVEDAASILSGMQEILLTSKPSGNVMRMMEFALEHLGKVSEFDLTPLLKTSVDVYLRDSENANLFAWLNHAIWKKYFKLLKLPNISDKPNQYILARNVSGLFNITLTQPAQGHHQHIKQESGKNHEKMVTSDCPDKIHYARIQSDAYVQVREEVDIDDAEIKIIEQLLTAIHTPEYIANVKQLSQLSERFGIRLPLDSGGDTFISPGSYLAALHAVSITTNIIAKSYQQKESGLCIVRPPGHHAGTDFGEGFCIFNNVAASAKKLIELGANRLLILDVDAHHGNGTLDILSRHDELKQKVTLYDFYDGDNYKGEHSSWLSKQPASPQLHLCDMREPDRNMKTILENANNVLKDDYDFIIVSFGLDGHRNDPLGGQLDYDDAFYLDFVTMLQARVPGKFALVLEGGYNIDTITRLMTAIIPIISNSPTTTISVNR